MKKVIVLVMFLACVLTVRAAISTTSSQEVRIGQQILPSVTLPRALIHPRPAYTDEARRRGIQGNVIVQAQFDLDGNFTVLRW